MIVVVLGYVEFLVSLGEVFVPYWGLFSQGLLTTFGHFSKSLFCFKGIVIVWLRSK